MGLFDLPTPLFSVIDGVLAMLLPPLLRLAIWGIISGWVAMLVYRLFSAQQKMAALKAAQKEQQKQIAGFDGEFAELLPLIRAALALGFRQLGLALGPALLASVPVLFIITWVAGEYGYATPAAGSEVLVTVEPAGSNLHWSAQTQVKASDGGWLINWPAPGQSLTLSDHRQTLLVLPLAQAVPIIHKQRWWNLLMGNPLGYLPADGQVEVVHIGLPGQVIIAAGPAWMRGWMFSFFIAFLLSSIGLKWLLRLH